MPATTNPLGIAPGEKASSTYSTIYTQSLGRKYVIDGKEWKVVKAGGTIAAATIQSRMMLDAGTTAKTNVVTAAAGAAAIKSTFAGIGHPSQVALSSGDFFLIQTAGTATVIAAAGGVTASNPVICAASGAMDDSAAGDITMALWSQIVGTAHATATSGNTFEVALEPIA